MSPRDWRRITVGYVVLSIMWLIGAGLTFSQQRDLDDQQAELQAQTFRLAVAATRFCEALRAPTDELEVVILARVQRGEPVRISPGCQSIARRLLAARPE